MSFSEGGLSAADVLALNGNNNRNGMFGDDLIGLIALAAVFGGGFGGFGGFGGWGGGGAGLQGIVTRADITDGFALQNITSGIQAIQQGICDATYALTGTITGGFHGLERSFWDISRQIGDCCCENRAATADLKYTIGQQGCETRNAMYVNTRDIIDNQNANYRGLMDFMVGEKLAAKDAKIAEQASQIGRYEQNAVLGARIDAAVAEILRRTGAECPSPAYLGNAPTPVSFPTNSYGQVQFGGCGCGCC
ncbi:MAG: hypothetical protein IJ334_05960 [Clostridia bacterium]|nr:hypothetical protein [Clostridia bacterium]